MVVKYKFALVVVWLLKRITVLNEQIIVGTIEVEIGVLLVNLSSNRIEDGERITDTNVRGIARTSSWQEVEILGDSDRVKAALVVQEQTKSKEHLILQSFFCR